jgi:hypothetical protein
VAGFSVNFNSFPYDSSFHVSFKDRDTILIQWIDTTLSTSDWYLSFEGDINNPWLNTMLSLNDLRKDWVNDLIINLKDLNCIGVDKNEDEIRIRYRGHYGESFDYVVLLNDKNDSIKLNHLSNEYYWQHREWELFCGWTDWGKY